MVVNRTDDNKKHVEFVEYTGEYPNLCRGTLTLKIDGDIVVFGNNKHDYPIFWESGGDAYFTDNYSESHVTLEEWLIDYQEIPEKYRKYADEIDQVFNENVEFGCCGGCL